MLCTVGSLVVFAFHSISNAELNLLGRVSILGIVYWKIFKVTVNNSVSFYVHDKVGVLA